MRALSRPCFKPHRALAVPAAMSTCMPTTPIPGKRMFTRPVMARVAYVTSPIPRLVSVEVVKALRPALRQRASVTVMRIVAVIDMAIKTVMAVKPGASSNKHPASKPIGSIVAVRSTVIGRVVEVSVRTPGSRPDVNADGNLGWRHRYTGQEGSCESCDSKRIDFEHDFSLIRSEFRFVQSFQTGQLEGQHNT